MAALQPTATAVRVGVAESGPPADGIVHMVISRQTQYIVIMGSTPAPVRAGTPAGQRAGRELLRILRGGVSSRPAPAPVAASAKASRAAPETALRPAKGPRRQEPAASRPPTAPQWQVAVPRRKRDTSRWREAERRRQEGAERWEEQQRKRQRSLKEAKELRQGAAASRIQLAVRDWRRRVTVGPETPQQGPASAGPAALPLAEKPLDEDMVLHMAMQRAAKEREELAAGEARLVPAVDAAVARLKPACPECARRSLKAKIVRGGRCCGCGINMPLGALGLACQAEGCEAYCCMPCTGPLMHACIRQEATEEELAILNGGMRHSSSDAVESQPKPKNLKKMKGRHDGRDPGGRRPQAQEPEEQEVQHEELCLG